MLSERVPEAGARLALGVSYRGQAYRGWQSQPGGGTVQDVLEAALSHLAQVPVRTVCAGRTDTGVHAIEQVVHLDAPVPRPVFSWVRGTNAHLPSDIAVQWCHVVSPRFHARASAQSRRYIYVLRESAVRPALEAGLVGWVFRPLDHEAMRQAAVHVLGEHDFTSFRSSQCQAPTPIKHLMQLRITRTGAYWRFEFQANAFLHHMVRNLMGCLVAIGSGLKKPVWMREVLAARSRAAAAPTFPAAGLYFWGPQYDRAWSLPQGPLAAQWLPGELI